MEPQHRSVAELAAFIMVTVDGYHEGVDGAFDFWNVDSAEFDEFSNEQLELADTLVFGRRTFEGMAEFWPSEDAQQHSPRTAHLMNSTPKIVASRTMASAEWGPTTIVGDIAEIAAQPGRSLVLGSSTLVAALAGADLLTELRMMMNPILIGRGTSVMSSVETRINLELYDVERFKSGNVLLTYRVPV